MNDIEVIEVDFKDKLAKSKNIYGYFTANVEGNPVVCYIEQGPDGGWIAVAEGHTDEYLNDENKLGGYINRHTWGWTFHRAEELRA